MIPGQLLSDSSKNRDKTVERIRSVEISQTLNKLHQLLESGTSALHLTSPRWPKGRLDDLRWKGSSTYVEFLLLLCSLHIEQNFVIFGRREVIQGIKLV